MTGDASSRRARLWFAVICVVTLLSYARSFSVPFQFDDFAHQLDRPEAERPGSHAPFRFARARLLPLASLELNHRLGGENTFGYHVVNFAIHLLATLAVFALVGALCRTPRLRESWVAERRLELAVAAAFLFACHPIQIQAVTYIVQRLASMVTLFYVGSVLLYVRARNAGLGAEPGRPPLLYLGSALLALAAFFSKENSASLPLAILLTEVTFFPSREPGRRLLRLAPYLALVLVVPLTWYVFGARFAKPPGGDATVLERVRYLFHLLWFRAHPRGEVTVLQYFLTECIVIPRYLRLVVLPWGFNVDHDVPIAEGLSAPVVAGFAFLAALLAFGLSSLRRRPLVGFGIVWLFLALSVESTVLPIQDPMVEHRMYLAMPGVALIAGVAFVRLLDRQRVAALVAAAAVAITLCTLTFLRNEVWLTPLSLWQDALAKSPGKVRVYSNVGTALHLEGRIDEAIKYYCKALAIDPDDGRTQDNLNAALEERLDVQAEAGELTLDRLHRLKGGFIALAPPDPCAPPAPNE